MIAIPWYGLIIVALVVASVAAAVVLIIQDSREIRTEREWVDIEEVFAIAERAQDDRDRVVEECRAEHPVISGGRRYDSIDAWMRHLAEPTPIYDRLVAEQKAEEQAGIRRRVEELGIDWTVSG